MRMSQAGLIALEAEEGVVLKAYRCPAGKWTIGAGLTAASGVVKPKAGMVITKAEASQLLSKALAKNYEPAVARQMPTAKSHEFDAGTGFHFNTGAINRASWVPSWRKRDWRAVEPAFKAWRKGGGRVLPGLVKRREREFEMLRFGRYHHNKSVGPKPDSAGLALQMTKGELWEVATKLGELGYEVGVWPNLKRAAVESFQRDHALTVDGVIGRATLSALQRRIDARRKAAQTAVGTSAGAAADTALATLPDAALYGILGLGAFVALYLAFTYRDVVAAKLNRTTPRTANFLRSF